MKVKKPWSKPVLIVIGRGTPEESVLGTCKTADTAGTVTGPSKKQCVDSPDGCATVRPS